MDKKLMTRIRCLTNKLNLITREGDFVPRREKELKREPKYTNDWIDYQTLNTLIRLKQLTDLKELGKLTNYDITHREIMSNKYD